MLTFNVLKFSIVCSLIIFQTINALSRLEYECISELQLNQGEIEKWNTQPIVPEDNAEFNKFMTCFWKKKGYQNEDGQINYASLETSIGQLIGLKYTPQRAAEIAESVIKTCRNIQKGNDDGAFASKVSNCIIRNLHSFHQ